MANYQTIINRINEEITTNGRMNITGAVLNGVLTAMVASLGTGCRFGGIVTPTSTVTEPDGNVFYFATQGGTYTACGGVVIQDGVSVIKYDGGTWGAMQLLWYDTEPRQDSTRLVLSGGIYDALQAQEERSRGVEQDMADLIAKVFDDEEVYQVTKVYSASVTDTNSRQTARKNRTYLNEISTKDGAVITSLKVEMGGADITKDVYLGPHSAEIIGRASGQEASDLQNGDSWASGEITPDAGWGIKSVRVQMGDDDITSEALSGHEVSVDDVNGDIAVEVETACEVVDEPFLSRITANGLTLANDRALIRSLHGNTLVWNQMVEDGSVERSASSTTLGGAWTIPQTFPKGHVFYIRATVKKSADYAANSTRLVLAAGSNVPSHLIIADSIAADDKWHTLSNTVLVNITYETVRLATYKYLPAAAGTFYAKDVILIDLTQMFGAGNEPTLAEFESLYPLGYYTTAAGRLLDFNGQTLRSVGFNLWDEEWEVGSIDQSTGENTAHSAKIRSKNFNPISPSTTYYLYSGASSSVNWYVMLYDANHNYFSYTRAINNTTFTTPENAAYFKIREAASSYGTTYKNDICINLSNTSLNGTYKPYSAQDITINPTAMYGYLNGEGEAVKPFENGMRSAGSVFDTVEKVDGKWYATVNIGSVDLGELTWALYPSKTSTFRSPTLAVEAWVPSLLTEPRIVASKYQPNLTNNIINKEEAGIGIYQGRIVITDTAYTDANTFKGSLDNVMLNYYLATPRTYLLTDEWQQVLNTAYQVETGGMEIILPENGNVPATSPAKMEIQYGTDGTENN